jgi:hypothetical protein
VRRRRCRPDVEVRHDDHAGRFRVVVRRGAASAERWRWTPSGAGVVLLEAAQDHRAGDDEREQGRRAASTERVGFMTTSRWV